MRWIIRLLGLIVVLAAFAVGAVFFLPKERIAAIAADQVRAQTGRDLIITGDLSLRFWPVLGVTTGPVALANADWAGDAPMVEAVSLSVGVDASALIGGAIRIRHIEINGPILRLATRADGRSNWKFDAPSSGATPGSPGGAEEPGTGFVLDTLTLTNGRLIYDAEGSAPVDLSILSLSVALPDAAGPATISGRFALGPDPLSVEAELGPIASALAGSIVPLSLQLSAEGGTATFDGRASLSPEAAGRFELSTGDLSRFVAALGVDGIALPFGMGRAADMTGDMTFTDGNRLALRNLQLAAGGNRVTGAADVVLSDVPNITAQFAADALDFSALATSGSGGAAASAETGAGAGWSTDPIDASVLGLLNGTISLAAQSIDTGDIRLGPSRLALNIDRARAVLTLSQVSIFGGNVTGQLVANNRSGLSVGGNIRADAIEMETALTDLADITRLSGKAGAEIEFLGVGQSMDAIMRSLSGKGALRMAQGLISGIDLDRLMRTGDGSGGTTVFDSLTASFDMQGGNLQNDDLLLMLKNFRADGAGRIGLGAQDIDYLFTPVALRVNSGQGLAIPIRIRGPWAGPRILPDLSQALQLDVNGKVEEVKQDAEQRVQQKIEEELDGALEDGQSVEDAVKDRLEDKAKEGLLNLLNRN